MREGKTLTRPMSIETRQHELFNVDLGEGAPRKALIAGMLITVVWCGLLLLVIGAPSARTATLFILPPALLTLFGWRENESNGRRRNITVWVLAARWLVSGHRPVIALGRQESTQHERSVVRRVGDRLGNGDPLTLLMPWRAQEERTHERTQVSTGRVERMGGRVQLLGTEAAAGLMRDRNQKKRKGKTR